MGVDKDATPEEIKKAYRLYASKFHPDKHSGDKFFEEKFKEIKDAYDILMEDAKHNTSEKEKTKTEQKQEAKAERYNEPKKENTNKNNSTYTTSSFNQKQSNEDIKKEKRQKSFLTGIGTAAMTIILFQSFGKYGYHVPFAMFFLCWTVRQIFVVLISFF